MSTLLQCGKCRTTFNSPDRAAGQSAICSACHFDFDAGFRRILYDAMTLAVSLRAVRECQGYPKPTAPEINGTVESLHMNALIQIRSMDNFLSEYHGSRRDTMTATHFPGCSKQASRLPPPKSTDPYWRSPDTYTAHKSWDAVRKDQSTGTAQISKPELVRLGMAILDGFEDFWSECKAVDIGVTLKDYAAAYEPIYKDAVAFLQKVGP
jgi:hypothetical protein